MCYFSNKIGYLFIYLFVCLYISYVRPIPESHYSRISNTIPYGHFALFLEETRLDDLTAYIGTKWTIDRAKTVKDDSYFKRAASNRWMIHEMRNCLLHRMFLPTSNNFQLCSRVFQCPLVQKYICGGIKQNESEHIIFLVFHLVLFSIQRGMFCRTPH